MDLRALQDALQRSGIDGWLFYDFRRSNLIAFTVLGLDPDQVFTRRWLYFVPARGEPVRIVSALEAGNLDALPGRRAVYRGYRELDAAVAEATRGCTTLAMEFSPRAALPVVSRVDAGTVDWIRALGKQVVSSADLVQPFEAAWSVEQLAGHQQAGATLMRIKDEALAFIAERLARGGPLNERAVQEFMAARMAAEGLITDHPPIVAAGPNTSNPHYVPGLARSSPIRPGDLILLDYWAKLQRAGAVYADYTWMAFAGPAAAIPEVQRRAFAAVRAARDATIEFICAAVAAGRRIAGWEADDMARGVIAARGYAEWFIHRTGHSIGTADHGNGANLDNYETHDERALLDQTGFSVEPGIYLPEFGVRSEVNVAIDGPRLIVTGTPIQVEITALA